MVPDGKALRRHEVRVEIVEVGPLAHRPADAARLLGVGLTTFRQHVQPTLATFEVGTCVLIPHAELERYVREAPTRARPIREVQPPAPTPLPVAIERALGRTDRRPRLHRKEDRQAS